MPDTPAIDLTATMRRHIAQKLANLPEPHEALCQAMAAALSPPALGSLPEPMRRRMLEEAKRNRIAEKLRAMADSIGQSAMPAEYFCTRDGHRLIPDDDDLFVCVRCAKLFRQVD